MLLKILIDGQDPTSLILFFPFIRQGYHVAFKNFYVLMAGCLKPRSGSGFLGFRKRRMDNSNGFICDIIHDDLCFQVSVNGF
ncbi:MAG TPA: hypothetical protein DDX07_10180 [Porphyromonadaceae bacterium]|nr:hypothetical protein [Porphyromonadaceae bacterium]